MRRGTPSLTIFDNWKTAVFDSYEPVFRLVTDFVDHY